MKITITIDLDDDAPQLSHQQTFVARTLAAITQLQRQERSLATRRGLEAARARGRCGGRPTVWTPERSAKARELFELGLKPADVALQVGVSRASAYRFEKDLANEA